MSFQPLADLDLRIDYPFDQARRYELVLHNKRYAANVGVGLAYGFSIPAREGIQNVITATALARKSASDCDLPERRSGRRLGLKHAPCLRVQGYLSRMVILTTNWAVR